ncbi:MAG: serine/threonine-protein kinase [Erythrobacter sp.]
MSDQSKKTSPDSEKSKSDKEQEDCSSDTGICETDACDAEADTGGLEGVADCSADCGTEPEDAPGSESEPDVEDDDDDVPSTSEKALEEPSAGQSADEPESEPPATTGGKTEFIASAPPPVSEKTEFMASPLPSSTPSSTSSPAPTAPDKTEFMASPLKPAAPPPPAHEPTEFMASPTPSPLPTAPPENKALSSTPPKPKAKQQQFTEGEVLNGIYRITRFLARGGMGEVYEATNIHQQSERVAIKVMLPHLAQDELVAAMFSKEAEMLTRLHHEAIVPYRMSARDAEGKPYIVTEFIDGPSLEEKLGKLNLEELEFANLAQKLAAGLGTAHSLGAVHRDIAPDNVLLAEGDPSRPKIIDFGIAKDARENTGTIVGDGFAGKLKYVAPEQLGEFDRNIGPWTDLYSLALTLRAVAAGKHSDMGGSLSDAVIKRQTVPDLSPIPERFHPPFEMALQPNPADRPQSMAEFILRLGDIGNGTAHPTGLMPRVNASQSGSAEKSKPEKKKEKKPRKGKRFSLAKKPEGDDAPKVDGALAGLTKNPAVLIGGGLAAVLLVVVVSIVLLSSGGSSTPDGGSDGPIADGSGAGASQAGGSQSGGTASLESPKVQQALNAAIAEVDCAWLTYEGASGGTAQFTGGAANPAAAQTQIISALEGVGAGSASIDVSNVIRFTDKSCAALDAMREVRSEKPLITSPQQVYEAEQQEVTRADGALIQEGAIAKAVMRVDNVPSNHEIALLELNAPIGLNTLVPDRAEVESFVQAIKGNLTNNGMVMPLLVPFEGPEKDSYAFIVVTSPKPFPRDIIALDMKFDDAWTKRFREAAKANGWKVDAVWFSIENRQGN